MGKPQTIYLLLLDLNNVCAVSTKHVCSYRPQKLPETRFKLLHMRQHFSTSQEFSWADADQSLLCVGLVDKHLTKQNEVHSNTFHGHATCIIHTTAIEHSTTINIWQKSRAIAPASNISQGTFLVVQPQDLL